MKKISRRDFLAASAAVGAAGVLTACGGSSSSTATSTAASTAASGKSTDYPTKGISVICPWSAGGGTDSCLRAFCEAMGKNLGVTLTVDTRLAAAASWAIRQSQMPTPTATPSV